MCPVAAVLTYAAARGSKPGPFFVTSAARALIKQEFVGEIRKVLLRLGLPDSDYAGHSFLIGAATSAAMAGVEDSTIQLLGRWQSAAFLRYIRTPTRDWRPSLLPSQRKLATTEHFVLTYASLLSVPLYLLPIRTYV